MSSLFFYRLGRALAPAGHFAGFLLWQSARALRFLLTVAFFVVVLCLAATSAALILPGVLGLILAAATYFLFQYVAGFWRL
jgi:hypothetical protein